ncbi:MAG: phosphoglycerate dehydrogenase [Anaerolineaceae bacterium]|nr:MAG: phosphoglycerate dehydrogenase [Anaerolineaceae bacterium]
MQKVLISPSSFGLCGTEPLDILTEAGFKPIINPYGRKLTAEEVVELAHECIGIVAGLEPLDRNVLDQLPSLRCISRVGAGMDNVDLQAAAEKGVEVHNTPDGPTQAVAELTVGLALALLRRIPQADRNLRDGVWQKEMGSLLREKTVGIVGLGRIGRKVAELFLGLGCVVVATDPNLDHEWLKSHPVPMIPLDDLLRQSDIITLHLAHEPGTGPIIGKGEINHMKKTACLLNLARGEVLDEEALYKALLEKRISGAALDVFQAEPYHGPLTKLDNVVLTPHLGSYAHEGRLLMEIGAVQNLLDTLLSEDIGSGRSGDES